MCKLSSNVKKQYCSSCECNGVSSNLKNIKINIFFHKMLTDNQVRKKQTYNCNKDYSR